MHGGRSRSEGVCFCREVPALARRIHGQPPGVQPSGEELVRHGQFAACRTDAALRVVRRRLPLPGDPAEGSGHFRRPARCEGRPDFHFRVLPLRENAEEFQDGGRFAVVDDDRSV
jgi:hypothetical protein